MRKTFVFNVPYSGYSRGYDVYEIVADNEGEALALLRDGVYGEKVERVVVRDDTETEWDEAELTS